MVLQAAPTLALEAWARGLAYQARVMVNLAWRAAQDLSARVDPDALALYRPKAGESLYSISIRFYQTPNRWRDIYERNRLRTFTLSGLETLVIPSTKVAR
jgi:nucleoid-associated protein YgaU